MTQFESATLLLQEDDKITSQKGMLFPDPLVPGKGQIIYKAKYEGNGVWTLIGERREFIDMVKK